VAFAEDVDDREAPLPSIGHIGLLGANGGGTCARVDSCADEPRAGSNNDVSEFHEVELRFDEAVWPEGRSSRNSVGT
jgi:hypothetical protein